MFIIFGFLLFNFSTCSKLLYDHILILISNQLHSVHARLLLNQAFINKIRDSFVFNNYLFTPILSYVFFFFFFIAPYQPLNEDQSLVTAHDLVSRQMIVMHFFEDCPLPVSYFSLTRNRESQMICQLGTKIHFNWLRKSSQRGSIMFLLLQHVR